MAWGAAPGPVDSLELVRVNQVVISQGRHVRGWTGSGDESGFSPRHFSGNVVRVLVSAHQSDLQ